VNKYFLFAVITALFIYSSSPAHAGNVIRWCDAAKHYEEYATVEGTVVLFGIGPDEPGYLYFDKNYKKHFAVLIPLADFHHFPKTPPVVLYFRKKIRVTGLIRKEQDRPLITVTNPEQIEIVK